MNIKFLFNHPKIFYLIKDMIGDRGKHENKKMKIWGYTLYIIKTGKIIVYYFKNFFKLWGEGHITNDKLFKIYLGNKLKGVVKWENFDNYKVYLNYKTLEFKAFFSKLFLSNQMKIVGKIGLKFLKNYKMLINDWNSN